MQVATTRPVAVRFAQCPAVTETGCDQVAEDTVHVARLVVTVEKADMVILQPQYQSWVIRYIRMSLVIVVHLGVSVMVRVTQRLMAVVVMAVMVSVHDMPTVVITMATVMLRVFTVVTPVCTAVTLRAVIISATTVVAVRLTVTGSLIGFIMVACTGKYRCQTETADQ